MNAKPTTVTAADVAEYILSKRGSVRSLKLQKLVYYSQAWSLVWSEAPLFGERIEAWVKGPVCPTLYERHEKTLDVDTVGGNPAVLSDKQRKAIDNVLLYYGARTSEWLSELTHREKPWIDARVGLDPEERGNQEITHRAMAEYYEGQACGGPRDEIDLEALDLGRLLTAEAEIRRGEVVDWDDLERELQDPTRQVSRGANQSDA